MLKNFNASVEVTPVNVEHGVEIAFLQALEETDVTAVGDQDLTAIEKSGKNHGRVHPDI